MLNITSITSLVCHCLLFLFENMSKKSSLFDSNSSNSSMDITALDFEEDKCSFRIPIKNLRNTSKSRPTKTKLSLRKNSQSNAISQVQENEKPHTMLTRTDGEEDVALTKIETSLSSDLEKVCPSCKLLVPKDDFLNHFSTCLQKFKFQKDGTSRNVENLPCPICLKEINGANRTSHIKSCGQSHLLSPEQILLATRLQEKQAEERTSLGLPLLPLEENRSTGAGRRQRTNKRDVKGASDPQLELALALSSSEAEEEAKRRKYEEDKLVQLGLANFVIEARRERPTSLLQHSPTSNNKSQRKRVKKPPERECLLATRSAKERESIVSEKVAAILAFHNNRKRNSFSDDEIKLNSALTLCLDKNSTLWNAAGLNHTTTQHYYVPQLEDYIQYTNIPVGGLLKHLSQVPDRLNYTEIEEVDEQREENIETLTNAESTIIDGYCTQLALAELLSTQEAKDLTFSNCTKSPEETAEFDFSNLEVTKGGFWMESADKNEVPQKLSENIEHSCPDVNSISEKQDLNLPVFSPSQATSPPELILEPPQLIMDKCTIGEQLLTDEQEKNNKSVPVASKNLELCDKEVQVDRIPSPYPSKAQDDLKSKFIYDWSVILNSSEQSDITLQTSEEIIKLHKLVLFVRCPILYEEAQNNDWSLCWETVSYDSAYAFLIYLYTGQCTIYSKDDKSWMALFDLALKYKCHELVQHLENLYKSSTPCSNRSGQHAQVSSFIVSPLAEKLEHAFTVCTPNSKSPQTSAIIPISPTHFVTIDDERFSEQGDALKACDILSISDIFEENDSADISSQLTPIQSPVHQHVSESPKDIASPLRLSTTESEGDIDLPIDRNKLISPPDRIFHDSNNLKDPNYSSEAQHSFFATTPSRHYSPVQGDLSSCIEAKINDDKLVDLTEDSNDSDGIIYSSQPYNSPTLSLKTTKEQKIDSSPESVEELPSAVMDDVWDGFEDACVDVHMPGCSPILHPETPVRNSLTASCRGSSEKDGTNLTSELNPPGANDNLLQDKFVSDSTMLQAADGFSPLGDVSFKVKQVEELKRKSTPFRSLLDTPQSKGCLITPKPNYKGMVTPELKKELEKFGIRKMSKNKAIKLLVHIYEEMHPLVADSEADSSLLSPLIDLKKPSPPKKGRRKKSNNVDAGKSNSSVEEELQNSSHSSNNSFECPEETIIQFEGDADEGGAYSQTKQGLFKQQMKAYIYSQKDLHQKILLYEPLVAQDLLAALKASGIKCGMKKLIDFLDEQCITFRFKPVGESRIKKRKRRSSKSPKKRKKNV